MMPLSLRESVLEKLSVYSDTVRQMTKQYEDEMINKERM